MFSSLFLLTNLLALSVSVTSTSLNKRAFIASTSKNELFGLAARQDVCTGTTCPGGDCIPSGYHCCSDGGAGCPVGEDCVPNGCCPIGESCSGGGGTMTFPGDAGPIPTATYNTGLLSDLDTATDFLSSATDDLDTSSIMASASQIISAAEYSATKDLASATASPSAPARLLASSTSSSMSSSTSPAIGAGSSGSANGGGDSSGGSISSGTTSSAPPSGARFETMSVVFSGLVMLVGLVVVQAL